MTKLKLWQNWKSQMATTSLGWKSKPFVGVRWKSAKQTISIQDIWVKRTRIEIMQKSVTFGYLTVDIPVTPSLGNSVTRSPGHSVTQSLLSQAWQSDWVTEWPNDQVTELPNDRVTEWLSDRETVWPNNRVIEWPNDWVTKLPSDRNW